MKRLLLLAALSLLFGAGCTRENEPEQIHDHGLFPGQVSISVIIDKFHEYIAQKNFTPADFKQYRNHFGSDFDWIREGNIFPVSLKFQPNQGITHPCTYTFFVLESSQKENIVASLNAAYPLSGEYPQLKVEQGMALSAAKMNFLPAGKKLEQMQNTIGQDILAGKINWELLNLRKVSAKNWRTARFSVLRKNLELHLNDFSLAEVIAMPDGTVRFTYFFAPLLVRFGGNSFWLTLAHFDMDRTGLLQDCHLSSAVLELAFSPIKDQLTTDDHDEISELVLRRLFTEKLAEPDIRLKEKYRFCMPAYGAGPEFGKCLDRKAAIPELEATREDKTIPVPFINGSYRGFSHGAFYYYAGLILPIDNKTVQVMDAAVIHPGKHTPHYSYKLTRTISGWEIISREVYAAPAVSSQVNE